MGDIEDSSLPCPPCITLFWKDEGGDKISIENQHDYDRFIQDREQSDYLIVVPQKIGSSDNVQNDFKMHGNATDTIVSKPNIILDTINSIKNAENDMQITSSMVNLGAHSLLFVRDAMNAFYSD
ncbi:uncharacterized protein LOC106080496 isoform X2 [Stomoxys calcitrans]|nr:uncharacterized protein LOC106080496 isoform X2 [Stomoxys calcitrans]